MVEGTRTVSRKHYPRKVIQRAKQLAQEMHIPEIPQKMLAEGFAANDGTAISVSLIYAWLRGSRGAGKRRSGLNAGAARKEPAVKAGATHGVLEAVRKILALDLDAEERIALAQMVLGA